MSLPKVSQHKTNKKFYGAAHTTLANKMLEDAKKLKIALTRSAAFTLAHTTLHELLTREKRSVTILEFTKLGDSESKKRVITSWVLDHYTKKTTEPGNHTYKFLDVSLFALIGVADRRTIRSCNLFQIVSIEVAPHVTDELLQIELNALSEKPTQNV